MAEFPPELYQYPFKVSKVYQYPYKVSKLYQYPYKVSKLYQYPYKVSKLYQYTYKVSKLYQYPYKVSKLYQYPYKVSKLYQYPYKVSKLYQYPYKVSKLYQYLYKVSNAKVPNSMSYKYDCTMYFDYPSMLFVTSCRSSKAWVPVSACYLTLPADLGSSSRRNRGPRRHGSDILTTRLGVGAGRSGASGRAFLQTAHLPTEVTPLGGNKRVGEATDSAQAWTRSCDRRQ
ncbi:hypothetical protein RRG08_046229 [Elysia crispata]|uniref:Uncharacterized protein n=1 Tax=Elysia crispata TaxID=231223 RepID=A0AAE0YNG9_9GAST|nr:hypothetical protein RRG08_046229 [Elysia crispata]